MVAASVLVRLHLTGGVPGHAASSERRPAARRRPRSAVIAMLTGVLGCLVAASSAAAADHVWSGAAPTTGWSAPGNWGDGAPSGAVGVLAFPRLAGECAAGPPASACYRSSNDRDGLSADAIFVDDGAGYDIGGNPITLGAGGLTAASAVADPGNRPSVLSLPIVLGAAQTWSMTGATPDEQLLVTGIVSDGGAHPLAITLANGGGLTLEQVEVGPVTISGGAGEGDGFVELGRLDDESGSTLAGRLNVAGKHPTRVTNGAGLLAIRGSVGPLRTSGGLIQVGQVDRAGTLAVNGDVTLDAQSQLLAYLNEPGTTPGASYSRLTADGDVDLAQASLQLTAGELPGGTACAQPGVGDELTIVSASGRLTGTFANAADGATLTLPCTGSGGDRPTARITYTASAVTATILTPGTPGAPTVTALSVAGAGAVTNQPLTLTAAVTSSAAAPSGTVTFRRIGAPPAPPLPGCERRPITPSGTLYTATCQSAFPASGATGVDAVFTPADGSPLAGSASAPTSVQVARAATTTSLTVSPGIVGVNQPAALTAHITPAWSGAAQPSGTVTFLGNGQRIAGCADLGVSGGQAGCAAVIGSGTARTTYAITAVYSGDDDFTSSASPSTTVTLAGPTAAAGGGAATPGGRAGPPAAATAPGKAKLGRASASANTVNAVVTCRGAPGQRCTVSLTLTISRRVSKTRVTTTVAGSKKVTLRAGDGITAHVRLNALAAGKLRRARKLSVTLTATENTARGTKRLPAQKVTIKALPRRGR